MSEPLGSVPTRSQSSFRIKNLLGLFFSLLVVAYVLFTLDWPLVFETFRKIDYRWLALSFAIYLLNYLFRTLRFRHLLRLSEIPFHKLLGVTSLYGMYLYLMPAKTGEVSYPLLLKNRLGVSLAQSTATLIVARFFDFAAIALFLPFVLVVFWLKIHPWIRLGSILFVAMTLSIGFIALWVIRSPRWMRFFERDRTFASSWFTRVAKVLRKLLISLQEIDAQREYMRIWLTTTAIWICVQANFYFIVLSMGFSLTIFEMIVVSIIMVPMTLLPLQGFANLGTHEVGWTAAFALFGYSQSIALAIAVSSHIVLLVFVLLLGGFGLALLGENEKGKNP